MGAWIETLVGGSLDYRNQSHPMWVRGLKLQDSLVNAQRKVAPYVGAWIETLCNIFYFIFASSHPMWVRGLKRVRSLSLQR